MKKLICLMIFLLFGICLFGCDDMIDPTVPNDKEETIYSITYISFDKVLDLEANSYVSGKEFVLPVLDNNSEYEFIGWYKDSNYSGSVVTVISSFEIGDKVFYAKWNKIEDPENPPVNPPVTTDKIEVLKKAISLLTSYHLVVEYSDNDTSGDYSYTNNYDVEGDNIAYFYNSNGTDYCDYIIYNETTELNYYYMDNGDGSYYYIDENSEYFMSYAQYVDFVYPLDVVAGDFEYDELNNRFVCKSDKISEEGYNLFGEELDGETYTSLEIYLDNDNNISKMVLKSHVNSSEYGVYDSIYTFSFSNIGNVNVDTPKNAEEINLNGEVIDISDVYDVDDNEYVQVEGVITGFVGNNFYIDDYTGGLYIYMGSNSSSNLKIGDCVSLAGTKTTYKGLVELKDIENLEVFDTGYEIDTILLNDLSNLGDNISRKISMSGLVVEKINPINNSGDNSIVVSDGINSCTLFISKQNSSSNKTKWLNIFSSLKVGQTINVSSAVISCFNDYQIACMNITELSVGYVPGDTVKVSKITTNTTSLSVDNGTTLEAAMEMITVYRYYNNGTQDTLEAKDWTYKCDEYLPSIAGEYEVTISYEGFSCKVVIVVKAVVQDYYKLTNYKSLDDFADSEGISHGMPTKGDVKALVIPVEFTDYKASPTLVSELNTVMFGTSEETGWESVSSYYKKTSYGKLNITGTVLDPVSMNVKSTNYSYKDFDEALELIIDKVLTYYDSTINFSDYDSDNDGYIDALYLIYTTPVDYESDSLWWATTSCIDKDTKLKHDNVYPSYYFFAGTDFYNEDTASGKSLKYNAETYIHETGHILGFDDLYDFDDTKGPKGGIGGGDMMDYNIGDNNPYTKVLAGWVEPIIMAGKTSTITLNSFGGSGDCIIIPKAWKNSIATEFYIVDFYTPDGLNELEKGYNGLFSVSGIRIYHVNAALSTSEVTCFYDLFKYNNGDTTTKLIELVEADGRNDILNNKESSNSDLFKVGDVFTNGKWHDKTNCGFSITVDSITTTATITIKY